MKQLKTFFYSIKRSLFDPKYYKDVTQASFWFSFKYLWFLLFILIIIKSFVLGGMYLKNRPFIQPGINKFLIEAQNFYPGELELKIRKGQLSTNVEEPYIFDLEEDQQEKYGKHFLIIDTEGSIEDYPNYETYVLATKNAVVYPSKSQNNEVQQTSVFYFRDVKQDLTLNESVYNNFLNIVRPYARRSLFFVDYVVLIALFLFLIFGSFFWAAGIMFWLIFIVFLVWAVNLIFKKRHSFGSLYRMGMHAVAWPILINEIAKLFEFPFAGFYTLTLIAWMLVILFSSEKKV